jgi:hypothetical protein
MAKNEQARLALLQRLNEALGPEHASTLMTALPAHDWPDLATRDDIRAIEERLENRILTALRRELTVQTRIYVLAIVTTVIPLFSVAMFAR